MAAPNDAAAAPMDADMLQRLYDELNAPSAAAFQKVQFRFNNSGGLTHTCNSHG